MWSTFSSLKVDTYLCIVSSQQVTGTGGFLVAKELAACHWVDIKEHHEK